MTPGIEEFRSYIRALGFEPPARIEPGRFERFSTNGKRGDDAGYAKLFPDCEGGFVGDFRSGEFWPWQAKRTTPFSDEERRGFLERIDRERREAEAERERAYQAAAQRAREIWSKAEPAPSDHAYLTRKGVNAHWLRLYRGSLALNGMNCDGALIVPLGNVTGGLQSLEFISPEGVKRYLPGGRRGGTYHAIGKAGDAACIVEGYATGATIFEATGYRVFVAGDAGNLLAVAEQAREQSPSGRLIICGDNDKSGTGQAKAEEAARAVGGELVIPEFGAERSDDASDFNDLAALKGLDAVRACIAAARASDAWGKPELLPELPPVPAFDFNMLPPALRPFVQDIAERMECPPEFPAIGALIMIGAATGRQLGIRPKQFDSWTVVPNLWGMLVGKPGIMKSPALAEAIKPLKKIQALAFEQYEAAAVNFEIAERAAKVRAGHSEAKARELLKKDGSADLKAILRGDDTLEEPTPKRFIVNDSTVQALAKTLEENPNGVLCERDELIGLLRSMDREGEQEARAFYLTAADGDKSFTVDRIMRGRGQHIPGVCVSIVGGIQPGVLAGYVRETQRSGVGDDGLLQRFGLMVYPDISKAWRGVDRAPDFAAREAVDALIARLCDLKPEALGAERDPHGEIPYLRFDSSAQVLFREWQADLEGRLRKDEEHPAVVSHLAKYRKVVPALALINHLCECGCGAVTESALGRALMMIEFLEKHARRVYSYAARPDFDAAKTILGKLRTGKLAGEFSVREVYRPGWSGLTTPEDARKAIRVLRDFGYLQEQPDRKETGRPSEIYRAHPCTKDRA